MDKYSLLLFVVIFTFIDFTTEQNANCDYYISAQPGQTYYVYNPNYPNKYRPGVTCRWLASCNKGYNCRLECSLLELPQSPQCSLDRFLVSRSGDPQLNGADTYCGTGTLGVTSLGENISIGLITSSNSPGGRVYCTLRAVPSNPINETCRCGYKKSNRIVGGQPTGINEYPSMAGIVDVRISQIECGGVIIHPHYVLTAGHCMKDRQISNTAVVVGEHDVTTGDSPATQVLKITDFLIHPLFNSNNYDYDIALILTATDMVFSDRVGPICLPFKYAGSSLAGAKVTALGWGTQFSGGPTSDVLRKVDLDIISQSQCQQQVSTLTPRQMCTYTPGKDACQDDSGGPLLLTEPSTGLLFNVGIISHGRYCASNEPGVNTRVGNLLDWIVANTPDARYCRK